MMKKITNQKMIRVLAICMLFLSQSHLMAQTLPFSIGTQTVCINSNEPYEVIPTTDPVTLLRTSNYTWSIITGNIPPTLLVPGTPVVGTITNPIHPITTLVEDWWIEVNWPTAGDYVLSVMETNNAIPNCSSVLMHLIVTVEPEPLAPIITNPGAICFGDANPTMLASTDLSGNGSGVFNWYADNLGVPGTLLASNSPTYQDPTPYPAPGLGIVQTYNYWVTEESGNDCEGPATMVTVTVTGLPANPTLLNTPYEACFGDPTNPLMTAVPWVGAGTNFNWYDVNPAINPGAIALATGISTYTSTEINSSTYTYWVEEVVGSCTSPATSFTFEILGLPASPTVSNDPITMCEDLIPGTTPNSAFQAVTGGGGSGFTWYDDLGLTNQVGTGVSYIPGVNQPTIPILAGIYPYWVTEDDANGCVSTPTAVTFTINELPLEPDVTSSSSTIICVGGSYPTLTANQGAGSTLALGTFTWYNFDPGTNASAIVISSGPSLTPTAVLYPDPVSPVTVPSSVTYNFWVTETSPGDLCEGPATRVTFTIHANPEAPTYTNNPHEICEGDVNPAFTAPILGSVSLGADLIWYDDITLTNQVGTGVSYTPGSGPTPTPASDGTYSYWVVDQLEYLVPLPATTCTSLPLQIDLEILPLPTTGPIYHN